MADAKRENEMPEGDMNYEACRMCLDAERAALVRVAELEERVEQLEDGLRDVLGVVEGWCRPMSDEEKLPAIKEFASQALSGPKKEGDG